MNVRRARGIALAPNALIENFEDNCVDEVVEVPRCAMRLALVASGELFRRFWVMDK